MQKVQSSNIDSIGYDSENKILQVIFKPDTLYHYFDVSEEVYKQIMASESKNKALRSLVFPNCKYQRMS